MIEIIFFFFYYYCLIAFCSVEGELNRVGTLPVLFIALSPVGEEKLLESVLVAF